MKPKRIFLLAAGLILLGLCIFFVWGCTGIGLERDTHDAKGKETHTSGHFWSLNGEAVGSFLSMAGDTLTNMPIPGLAGIGGGLGLLGLLVGHRRGTTKASNVAAEHQKKVDAAFDEGAARSLPTQLRPQGGPGY